MLRKFRCVQILKYYTSATVGTSPKLQREHDNKNICYGRTSSSRSGHNRVQHSQLYNDVTKTVVPAACGQPSSCLRIWPANRSGCFVRRLLVHIPHTQVASGAYYSRGGHVNFFISPHPGRFWCFSPRWCGIFPSAVLAEVTR